MTTPSRATRGRAALLASVLLVGCGGDSGSPASAPKWTTWTPRAYQAPPAQPGSRRFLYIVESRLRTDVTGLAARAGGGYARGFRSEATCRSTSRRAFSCRARSFYRTERDGRTCINLILADYVGAMSGKGRVRYRRSRLEPAPTPECYRTGTR
jgi:hypothetical protein